MKEQKEVIDLEIIENIEQSGVFAISLVDVPAIEKNWMAFKKEVFVTPSGGESKDEFVSRCIGKLVGDEGYDTDQAAAICYSTWEEKYAIEPNPCWEGYEPYGLKEDGTPNCIPVKTRKEKFESYTDYPDAAVNAAKRALAWAEENGWGDCGMGAGKARANQLANREPISEETIARMSAFQRHRQNKDTPYGEGCGKLMWDAWGGDAGIEWAERKLKQIRKEEMSYDVSALPPYVDEIPKKKKEKMEGTELDIYGYRTSYFYICPGAKATFTHLMEMNPDEETIGMIRAAAVIADSIFDLEEDVIEEGVASFNDVKQAVVLTEDFMDVMGEIDEALGMEHDVDYMIGHVEKIKSYYTETTEEFAAVRDLKVGDAVSWKVGGQNPRGRITEIIRNGGRNIPGSGFVLRGTEEDPGYIIEIYEKKDGRWTGTGQFVGRKAASILKNVELWRQQFSSEDVDFNAILEVARNSGFTAEQLNLNGLAFSKAGDDKIENLKSMNFAKGYSVYRYEGSVGGDSRDFCREMMSMDKFYTYEEVASMGSAAVNPGFGLGGASTYSIWKYKGGPNCKHRWQKYYVNEAGKFENKGAAPGIAGERPYNMENRGYAMTKQMFASEDQRIVVGAAMIPDIIIPRKDPDTGERYEVRFSKEAIAKIAEKFMRELRNDQTNVEHDGANEANSYVKESWIVETEDDKANTKYGLDVPVGTWMVSMRVQDPAVWKMVKEGKLNGFSIEGNFMSREDYEKYQKDRELYNKVVKILKSM